MPSDLEGLTATLRASYERVWGQVLAEQTRLLADFTALNRSQRLRRLRETRQTIEGLMDVADELALRWALRDLPDAYQLGARQAARVAGGSVAYSAVDVDAVNSLVFDARQSLLDATTFVKRSTKELVNRLATEHMATKLIRGQTAEQAGRVLALELEGHGITAVVYRDGSRHGLGEYARMSILTRTAETYQMGGFQQTLALDIKYMELFDGSDCGLVTHDSYPKANGLILPTREAMQYPLSHPNCGRSSSPRPGIETAQQARDARPSTTEAQRADQAAAEARRTESVAARAARRRLEAQGVQAGGILSDSGNRVTSPAAARAIARRESRPRRTARAG